MEEKTKSKLSRYTDPTGEFGNRSLKMAEWYLKHKLLLQKIGKWLLVIWCALTISYSFGYWLYYFSYGYFQDKAMMVQQIKEFPNYSQIHQLYGAKNLEIGGIKVYNSVSDKYDFVAEARNPNRNWMARVTYKFVFGNGETKSASVVLLPKSERPIVFFGHGAGAYPNGASLAIEKVEWRRLKPPVGVNIGEYISEHSKFLVENFKFTSASRAAGILNNMIEFDLANNTAYNFWDAEFYVELKDGGARTGMIHLNVDKFKSGEKRSIVLRSWADDLYASDAVVWPVMNVFDKNEYMEVES